MGLTISRTTDLPVWLNFAVNVGILYLTVKLIDINIRSVHNSGNTVRLLDEINNKLNNLKKE